MSRHLSFQQEKDVIALLRRSGVSEELLHYNDDERSTIRCVANFLGLPNTPFLEDKDVEKSLQAYAMCYRMRALEYLKKIRFNKVL